jgi:DNA-binding beta-propeller fold protein YncE
MWGTEGSQLGDFTDPWGIAVNSSGYVFVTDTENNRVEVFNQTGQFVTAWGQLGPEAGNFSSPEGIAIDGSGLVYVADTGNNRVEVFTSTGAFVRQWGTAGLAAGQMLEPMGIALDQAGNVIVSDVAGSRVQEYSMFYIPPAPALLSVSPSESVDGNISVQWSSVGGATSYALYRSLAPITSLGAATSLVANTTGQAYNDALTANGTYYYAVTCSNASGTSGISNCLSVVVAIPPASYPSSSQGSSSPPSGGQGSLLPLYIGVGGVGCVVALSGGLMVRRKQARRRNLHLIEGADLPQEVGNSEQVDQ